MTIINKFSSSEHKIVKRNTTVTKHVQKLFSSNNSKPATTQLSKDSSNANPSKTAINKIQSSNYTASGMLPKAKASPSYSSNLNPSTPRKGSKFGFRKLSPSGSTVATKTGIPKRTPTMTERKPLNVPSNHSNTSIKQPQIIAEASKKPSPEQTSSTNIRPVSKLSAPNSNPNSSKNIKNVNEATNEKHRKMLAERKLMLKQKMAAIKIQKYWKAKFRRRKMRLQRVKYLASIRRIQRWFRSMYYLIKNKKEALAKGQLNIDSVVKIQRKFRTYKN